MSAAALWFFGLLAAFLAAHRLIQHPLWVFVFPLLLILAALVRFYRKVTKYNREDLPRLQWHWDHTYQYRRCGNLDYIPPASAQHPQAIGNPNYPL
jgi:hypothetical protein